jgi:type I restriction enzyme, S subunit
MKMVPLTSICKPKQWKTISTKDLKEHGYPVYGANGKIGFYDKFTHEHPTVLITCRGATCGTINVSEQKSYVNGNAMALDNLADDVDMYYLAHFLRYRKLDDVISGSAQPQITGQGLSKLQIPLPPLAQQQKIAAILDAADAYRQKTKALIAKYDELTQSLFLDMFGDPVKNEKGFDTILGRELFDFSSGKFNPTKNLSPNFQYPTYGGNGITGFSNDFLIDFDTIVIGRVGAYCGSIHKTTGKIWVTDNAIYIKNTRKQLDLTYAFHFLNKYGLNRFADFSGQPKITQKPLENMKFIYPELALQNQFAERVQAIEEQKAQAQASLEKAEELFNSLLQRAFKGELV